MATAVASGVASQGKSIEEAKSNLQEALELYYEDQEVEKDSSVSPLLTPVEVNL